MKKYLTHFLIAFITSLPIVPVIIWFVDPFTYFRVPTWHKPVYFIGWQRFQNIGIALNYDYDSVVIGTSVAENFSTNQIDTILGWKTVNLAISGSSAYEQRRLLELAIKTGKVKNVLWVVQYDAFAHPVNFVRSDAIYPEGFYNGNHTAFLQHYLLNTKMLEHSVNIFFNNNNDMDTAWNLSKTSKFGCASVTGSYNNTNRDLSVSKAFSNGDMLADEHSLAISVQKNLSDVVKQNPNVKFYLILPPYSKWAYKLSQEKLEWARMAAVLNFRKNIAGQLSEFENVTLSDYQSDIRVILDSNYYKDLIHYSPRITSMMVDEIGRGVFLPMQPESKFLALIKLQGNCLDE
jgi:hypothetical protein